MDKSKWNSISLADQKAIEKINEESARWANAVKPLLDEFAKEM